MKLENYLLAAAGLAAAVNASVELPKHARGGKAWQQMQQKSLVSAPASPLSANATTAQFWSSRCDHFSASDSSTFQQKYYVDSSHWDGKGPILLYIGGEGDLSPPSGYVVTLAEKQHGLVVALEHRFYGESIPNDSATTANYALLTVEQALADLASFTEYFKTLQSPTSSGELASHADSQWFGFGGSYPGALASWYRTAYPDSTVGTLSSSGVVNCIVDYTDFDKAVTAAVGSECAAQIRKLNGAYERMIGPKDGEAFRSGDGWKTATGQFHCEPDMWYEDFFYMIADSWSMADQYGAKSALCPAILAPGPDASDLELTQAFSAFSAEYWGEDFCSGGFYNSEQLADPSRWDVNSRSWRWQTCYQVSYFNTAPARGSLRSLSVDMDYHLKQCAYVFGEKMWPSSAEVNKRYGADEPKASNVFYSDFSDDPWQRASVDYSVSDSQPYFLSQCDDCGHCKDLHAPSPDDPEPIQQSRAEFERYMNQWLAEARDAKA